MLMLFVKSVQNPGSVKAVLQGLVSLIREEVSLLKNFGSLEIMQTGLPLLTQDGWGPEEGEH